MEWPGNFCIAKLSLFRWGHPPRGGSRDRSRSRSRYGLYMFSFQKTIWITWILSVHPLFKIHVNNMDYRDDRGRGRGGDRPVWLEKYGPPTRCGIVNCDLIMVVLVS